MQEIHKEDLATPEAAAKFLGVTVVCLGQWRRAEPFKGPVFYQLGRVIFYPIKELTAWANTHPPVRTPAGFLRYPHGPVPRDSDVNLFEVFETKRLVDAMKKLDTRTGPEGK